MNTIKIYEVTVDEAYMMSEKGTCFSLAPWGDNTIHYKGTDDGGQDYIIPDEYEVLTSNGGTLEFYRKDDRNHCPFTTENGRPAIVDTKRQAPGYVFLKKAV
jgi:hypothetical protein